MATAQLISGTEISKKVKEGLKQEVESLKQKGIVPGLATVLIGDNPASAIYVKNKIKSCGEIGVESFSHHLDENISQEEALALLELKQGALAETRLKFLIDNYPQSEEAALARERLTALRSQ